MAKIDFAQREKAKGDAFDGFEATFDGKTFVSKFWIGDSRYRAAIEGDAKAMEDLSKAHKERLYGDHKDEAQKLGRPLPEKEAK